MEGFLMVAFPDGTMHHHGEPAGGLLPGDPPGQLDLTGRVRGVLDHDPLLVEVPSAARRSRSRDVGIKAPDEVKFSVLL
jgi:hypothetical protein